MRKLLALTLALLLLAGLAACGDGETSSVPTSSAVGESSTPSEPVEIVQISDIHFNGINDQDRKENNPTIMEMANFRKPFPLSRVNAAKCLQYADYFDRTIITGDTIDYLSWGAIEMVKTDIWAKYPDVVVALGNHDSVRTWTHVGMVRDTTSRESRYEILQQNWKHDVYYHSEVLGNKVMTITIDNGSTTFYSHQLPKLEADIAKARQNGYVVLMFMHIPISTGDKNDTAVPAIRVNDTSNADGINFYATACNRTTNTNKTIYNLITNSADVIKGIFCGHEHSDGYAEIHAKTAGGEDAVIPQYLLTGAFYDNGHVMKITVK